MSALGKTWSVSMLLSYEEQRLYICFRRLLFAFHVVGIILAGAGNFVVNACEEDKSITCLDS